MDTTTAKVVSHSAAEPVEEGRRTYTVRELIAALANAENMDATVCIQLASIRHEPCEVTAVDFDPDNDQFIVQA